MDTTMTLLLVFGIAIGALAIYIGIHMWRKKHPAGPITSSGI